MRILVFEYVTGGGLRDTPLPPSLAREGGLMRSALLADLGEIPGLRVEVLHDDRLSLDPPLCQQARPIPIGATDDLEAIWLNRLSHCDAAWPIAPETDGILERLCRQVIAAGKRLLNSHPDAVRLASSKQTTLERLDEAGVPVVPSYRRQATPADLPFPRVIKPDDGAGCDGLRLIRSAEQWPQTMPDGTIVQPFLDGDALSLSALFCDGKARLLSGNRQVLTERGSGLTLTSCQVSAIPDGDGRWQRLADAVAQAIPGLWGYAGIDLILTDKGPRVLEINPRLTTSYAALRQALGFNPAQLILQLLATGRLPPTAIASGAQPVDVCLDDCHE